jgi:hypothetical protein
MWAIHFFNYKPNGRKFAQSGHPGQHMYYGVNYGNMEIVVIWRM